MKHFFTLSILFTWILLSSSSHAHFGMVIPSTNHVTSNQKIIELSLSFSHPFERIGMDLEKPEKFYVIKDGAATDLTSSLQETRIMDHRSWQSQQKLQRPGVYHFIMQPTPYWEPAEDVYIIHYTKTIVAAFGADDNWDQPAGLPTEIIPLTRPFGNYAGNSFSGMVLLNNTPVPNGEIEVEYYNSEGKYSSASDYHITQVIKADQNGIFNFTCPLAGWWGFSALNTADFTLKAPDNSDKEVELGAVLWVFFDAYVKGE